MSLLQPINSPDCPPDFIKKLLKDQAINSHFYLLSRTSRTVSRPFNWCARFNAQTSTI